MTGNLNRREFLKKSATVAAGTALGPIFCAMRTPRRAIG